MSWNSSVLEAYQAQRGEAVCVIAPQKAGCSDLLAHIYIDALQRGVTDIKVVSRSLKTTQEFFETTVPAAGGKDDIFAIVDNEALDVTDAKLVLLDNIDAFDTAQLKELVEKAHSAKLALVVVAPTDDSPAMQLLAKLKRRYVRL